MFSGLSEQLLPLQQQWLKPLVRTRVAVSIGADQVTVLAHQQRGRQLLLQSWQQAPLPPGLCEAGVPLHCEALGDLIGDLLLQGAIQAPGATALVPAPAVVLRVLELPAELAAAQDPAALLQWLEPHAAELELPFALELASLSLQPRGDRWLAAFITQASLDAWIDTFAVAGLDLHGLEPEVLAVESLLPSPALQQPGLWRACLDQRQQPWQLLLWQGQVPLLHRSLEPDQAGPWIGQLLGQQGISLNGLWLLPDPAAPWDLVQQQWSERLDCPVHGLNPFRHSAVVLPEQGWTTPAPVQLDPLLAMALGRLQP
ncbi:MAG: hypothetical protein VKJ87_01370 [Synechococcus sp.]|nr:hypothetical protein [Synechococcus sp.]